MSVTAVTKMERSAARSRADVASTQPIRIPRTSSPDEESDGEVSFTVPLFGPDNGVRIRAWRHKETRGWWATLPEHGLTAAGPSAEVAAANALGAYVALLD